MQTMYTLGDLARRFNVSLPQVKYALEASRIEARQRVGIVRVWNDDDLPAIESALKRIAERRASYGR